jgi:hypothetical protein
MISLLILLLVLVALYYINHYIPFTPDWLKMIVDVILGLIAVVQILYFVAPMIPGVGGR